MDGASAVQVPLSAPAQGWSVSFVEAALADGLVATSQAYVLPDTYPQQPPQVAAGCSTLADSPAR